MKKVYSDIFVQPITKFDCYNLLFQPRTTTEWNLGPFWNIIYYVNEPNTEINKTLCIWRHNLIAPSLGDIG